MAIVQTQISLLPSIRPTHIDPNTAAPTIGTVAFFETDKVTPKDVFMLSGDPPSALPFIVAPNPIQLGTDGGFVVNGVAVQLYGYLFDEDDSTVDQLYYVEVIRTDTSVVYPFDNFPIQQIGVSPDEEEEGRPNLAPSYGFGVRSYPVFFNEDDNQSASDVQVKPSPGWVWFRDQPTNTDWFYNFETIATGTDLGDPAYELTLTAANSGASQTINWFGFPLISDNTLSGKTINYQLFVRDKSLVAVTSLQIGVAIDGDFTPTVVGSIPLSTSRTLNTLSFTMPDLSAQLTTLPLRVYLVVLLPLSMDFEIAFTGTYPYEGVVSAVVGGIAPPFLGFGGKVSEQFWAFTNEGFGSLLGTDQSFENMGLALSPGKGDLFTRNSTGTIFISAQGQIFNYAVHLDGRTLVINQLLNTTLTNRFLQNALAPQAGNSFVITNLLANTFDIATKQTSPSYSTWASQTAAVTIVDNTTTGAGFGITSTIDGGDPTLLHVTFSSNFFAEASAVAVKSGSVDNIAVFTPPPADGVFNNWIGVLVPGVDLGDFTFSPTAGLTITTTNVGSGGAPATADFQFTAGAFPTAASIQTLLTAPFFGASVFLNYISYVASQSAGDMPVPPPFVIEFHVDNAGADVPTANAALTVNLSSGDLGSGIAIASATNTAINADANYTMTVNSVPLNGDQLDISTTDTDLIVLFHNTAQIKPINPTPSRLPIFVEITSGDTTTQIALVLSTALKTQVGGIPTAGDLITNGVTLPPIPSVLQYNVET